jgi:hypothetical protein
MTGPHQVRARGLEGSTTVGSSTVKEIINLLPHLDALVDGAAIAKVLAETNGNVNDAVSKLLDAGYGSSQPSTPAGLVTPGSSSVEREGGDDYEESRPAKRRRVESVSSVPEESDGLKEGASHPGITDPQPEVAQSGAVKVKVEEEGLALPAPSKRIKIKLTISKTKEGSDGDLVRSSDDEEVVSDFVPTTSTRRRSKKKSKARPKGKRTKASGKATKSAKPSTKVVKSASKSRTTRPASAPL